MTTKKRLSSVNILLDQATKAEEVAIKNWRNVHNKYAESVKKSEMLDAYRKGYLVDKVKNGQIKASFYRNRQLIIHMISEAKAHVDKESKQLKQDESKHYIDYVLRSKKKITFNKMKKKIENNLQIEKSKSSDKEMDELSMQKFIKKIKKN